MRKPSGVRNKSFENEKALAQERREQLLLGKTRPPGAPLLHEYNNLVNEREDYLTIPAYFALWATGIGIFLSWFLLLLPADREVFGVQIRHLFVWVTVAFAVFVIASVIKQAKRRFDRERKIDRVVAQITDTLPVEIEEILQRAEVLLVKADRLAGKYCCHCLADIPDYEKTLRACSDCEAQLEYDRTHCQFCNLPFTSEDPDIGERQHEGCDDWYNANR